MVDEEVVVDKLRYINQYTGDLKQMRGMTRQEYVEDMVTQRAVERTLMNLIQVCIDLAHEIVYDVLHDDLRWFDQFQQEVAKWFQQCDS